MKWGVREAVARSKKENGSTVETSPAGDDEQISWWADGAPKLDGLREFELKGA